MSWNVIELDAAAPRTSFERAAGHPVPGSRVALRHSLRLVRPFQRQEYRIDEHAV